MGIKLLLADDSITIQKVVGIIFSSEDYDLTIVDNGDAALAKAREIMPDVLLVDAVMPGRTGYEVCEEVRQDARLKGVPILLLTGAFEPFDEESALRRGADDFIAKPFESQHLIDKVTSLVELGMQRKSAPPAPMPAPPPSIPAAAETAIPPAQAIPAAYSPPPTDTASQFAVEIVDGTPDDDLWGAFELEDVAEEESTEFGEVSFAVEEEPFGTEVVEEPFSFAEEPETVAPSAPAGFAPQWEPVAEDAFAFEEGTGGEAFETVAEEDAGEFGMVPEDVFGVIEEEAPPVGETIPTGFGGFFTEPVEPAAVPSAAPAEFELQFAPEEEYVPVVESAPPAPAPAAPGEVSLNEEQLAALVSRISRDLLEKIAWEVVPDLAERIIREEIRKIKEGQ